MKNLYFALKGKTLAAGGLVATALVSSAAFAQATSLSETVIAELTTGKAEVLAVGGAILTIVAVVALIRHVRSAAR